jgi:hypothetical protein
MKPALRIGLYLVLVILAAYFFGRFRSAYSGAAPLGGSSSELTSTNEPTGDTNAAPASAAEDTGTNAPAARESGSVDTNAPAGTELSATATNTPPAPAAPASTDKIDPPKRSDSLKYMGLFVLFFVALGGLAAWDASQYLGNRAGRTVMADDWIERKDPQYEKAEEEWSKGNHLDAISLMREYLAKNPQQQHVAIRIAEIYEKDLGNYLAAALELQEVLTKRLPKERWGWTAVRLANLYSGRLNQPDKAMALLQRIVTEYSGTAAAKKARNRLGIPEPEEAAPIEDATPSPEESAPDPEFPETPLPPDPSSSNLPKGFRPKK